MVRISGVTLPDSKRIVIALTYVYGIGKNLSLGILDTLKIDENLKTKELSEDQINSIRKEIDKNFVVEADLRRKVSMDIKSLQESGSYKGIRHRLGLPVRGQRTKTNARSRKGPKKTVANKKG